MDAKDFTIRYEGTQWALYRLGPQRIAGTDKPAKTYLGTFRHKELAEQERDRVIAAPPTNPADEGDDGFPGEPL